MDETIIRILQWFVAGCVAFTSVCVAASWMIKVIKGIKKPKDDIDAKLQRDYNRLNDLETIIKEFQGQFIKIDEKLDLLDQQNSFLLENDIVGFEHMRTNNATGRIAEREHDLQQYLLQRHHEKIWGEGTKQSV